MTPGWPAAVLRVPELTGSLPAAPGATAAPTGDARRHNPGFRRQHAFPWARVGVVSVESTAFGGGGAWPVNGAGASADSRVTRRQAARRPLPGPVTWADARPLRLARELEPEVEGGPGQMAQVPDIY
jgi:hypothetical protein